MPRNLVFLFKITHTVLLLGSIFAAFSREQKLEAVSERGLHCQLCGREHDFNGLYPHHILPAECGGVDVLENMLLVCSNCHTVVDEEAQNGQLADGYELTELRIWAPNMIGNIGKYEKFLRRVKVLEKNESKRARKKERFRS